MEPTMDRLVGKVVYRSWTAPLLVAAFFLSACGDSDKRVGLQQDPQLVEHAQQAIRNGETVPLRQITGGDWDQVHVFPGPTTQEFVKNTVGTVIDMPDIYEGGMVVFMKGGMVERAVEALPYPFDGNGGSYGPNALATPMPADGKASWLRLSE